ncbi:hypothetical protein ACA910_002064 [Epithemia clementina (nom. ined.)]
MFMNVSAACRIGEAVVAKEMRRSAAAAAGSKKYSSTKSSSSSSSVGGNSNNTATKKKKVSSSSSVSSSTSKSRQQPSSRKRHTTSSSKSSSSNKSLSSYFKNGAESYSYSSSKKDKRTSKRREQQQQPQQNLLDDACSVASTLSASQSSSFHSDSSLANLLNDTRNQIIMANLSEEEEPQEAAAAGTSSRAPRVQLASSRYRSCSVERARSSAPPRSITSSDTARKDSPREPTPIRGIRAISPPIIESQQQQQHQHKDTIEEDNDDESSICSRTSCRSVERRYSTVMHAHEIAASIFEAEHVLDLEEEAEEKKAAAARQAASLQPSFLPRRQTGLSRGGSIGLLSSSKAQQEQDGTDGTQEANSSDGDYDDCEQDNEEAAVVARPRGGATSRQRRGSFETTGPMHWSETRGSSTTNKAKEEKGEGAVSGGTNFGAMGDSGEFSIDESVPDQDQATSDSDSVGGNPDPIVAGHHHHAMVDHHPPKVVLKSCLVRQQSRNNSMSSSTSNKSKTSFRVVIDESRNQICERPIPITKKESEACWYTPKECKQMKFDTSEYAYRAACYLSSQDDEDFQNPLAMGYKTCCETLALLSKAQVQMIKKCLEQSRCTGLEQVLIESVKLINNDKKLRRQKILAMAVYRANLSAQSDDDDELAELLRDKCAELSLPGELFALALGQAQQQTSESESLHQKAPRRPSLWDRLRAKNK